MLFIGNWVNHQSIDLFEMGDSTARDGGDKTLSERNVAEEVSRLVEQSKELQESASTLISRNSQEESSLRQRAVTLDSDIKKLRTFIGSSVKKGNLDSKHEEKLGEELSRASYTLGEGDAATFLPCKSHGRFLRMLLGPINVRANRQDIQLKVKEEYYSFRDRTAYLFLFFPSLLLVLRSSVWDGCFPALPVQIYQAWLLFLYTGLALRENILRVNGSDIRPWWIYHHYFAMAMALISLTWEIERQPDCSQKQKGIQLFLRWAIMQGVAMLLQNRYQRQRLYTRIALGKARRMDVVWGETAGVKGQIWILLPILFVLQAFEAYVGVLLLKTAVMGVISEWQVVTCGILLIIMAVGNFANTVQTLVLKSQFKAKMRKGKIDPSIGQSNRSAIHKRPNRAAVLICLFEEGDDIYVILTQRSSKLSSHSGEVSLPGGRTDEEDTDDIRTALREAEEEIGLDPALVDVITVLEPFVSKFNVTVVPVIGILRDKQSFNPIPNPGEVESIFYAPLDLFLKDKNRRQEEKELGGNKYLLHYFDYETNNRVYVIWALTAGILIAAASLVFRRPPDFEERPPNFWHKNHSKL
ncbi:hypothetical protein LXL04_010299 [Taraxacum kok-saghyz]